MTIKDANDELRSILLDGNVPILFLGSGFSIGAHNKSELLDGKSLGKLIFDRLIKEKVPESDYEEIQGYNLRDLCSEVYSLYHGKKELSKLLVECFSQTYPKEGGFHYKLLDYPWKKIYTVNIDDLVENIYAAKDKSLFVQNKKNLQNEDSLSTILYKLHGCVKCPEEGFVFSSDEYLELTTKMLDARVCNFTDELLNNNIIFVGASLDEPDIEHFLKIYADSGMRKRKNKLIFIDYEPKRKLKSRVKELGGILIQASAQEFLEYVSGLNYNPNEVEKAVISLNYNGIYRLSDLKKLFVEPYESKLYEGNFCKWQDIYDEWFFTTDTYKKAVNKLDFLVSNMESISCFCLYGTMFSGKSSILKALAFHLEQNGYDILEYRSKILHISPLIEYINTSTNQKFVLVVDCGAYYYETFEKIFATHIGEKRLVILSASREYYHSKKKYYLEGNNYCDYYVDGEFKKEDVEMISRILNKKAHLSYLASFDETKRQREIFKMKNIINLLLGLTYGNISHRIEEEYKRMFSYLSQNEKKMLTELAIFNIADVEHYPRVLFAESYGGYVNLDGDICKGQIRINDYARIDEQGITLRNSVLNTFIITEMRSEIKDILINVLKKISRRVSERKNDMWYIIFQCLLKDDILQDKLKLNRKERNNIYFSVKEEYKHISYYWLQLGLFFQKCGDYTAAYNYLEMSSSIRPNSFKIQHAIARNFLRHANNTKNKIEALALFKNGETRMKELIESKEYYKEKAKLFSVNCYVSEKIHFCNKFCMCPENSEIRYMYSELKSVIDNRNDPYMDHVCESFFAFLEKNGKLSVLRINLDSPLFKYVGKKNIIHDDILLRDPVTDSI